MEKFLWIVCVFSLKEESRSQFESDDRARHVGGWKSGKVDGFVKCDWQAVKHLPLDVKVQRRIRGAAWVCTKLVFSFAQKVFHNLFSVSVLHCCLGHRPILSPIHFAFCLYYVLDISLFRILQIKSFGNSAFPYFSA